MIKICSINFWESAFNQDFLHYLVQESTNHEAVYVESVDDADIVFSSVLHPDIAPLRSRWRRVQTMCVAKVCFLEESCPKRTHAAPFSLPCSLLLPLGCFRRFPIGTLLIRIWSLLAPWRAASPPQNLDTSQRLHPYLPDVLFCACALGYINFSLIDF